MVQRLPPLSREAVGIVKALDPWEPLGAGAVRSCKSQT